ncbi:SMI1/KNR4 family protein [Psychrobacter pygoscelis]|uniref:SMI1/KNR4 family protein n=1 Tax=Psychrobacter pygoscelis TaxID=2488563 RepID=UPI00103A7EA9|nr:SMI1/KNR4 family protein [Psychrobacter pygoscelis]
MPTQKILYYLNLWQKIVDELEEDELNSMRDVMSSIPDGHVKKLSINPFWLPFAHDHGGNFLGIDLEPDSLGTVGQVINFG